MVIAPDNCSEAPFATMVPPSPMVVGVRAEKVMVGAWVGGEGSGDTMAPLNWFNGKPLKVPPKSIVIEAEVPTASATFVTRPPESVFVVAGVDVSAIPGNAFN